MPTLTTRQQELLDLFVQAGGVHDFGDSYECYPDELERFAAMLTAPLQKQISDLKQQLATSDEDVMLAAASQAAVAVPDELTCDDIERLRVALSWEGYSTPEGLEECAARWPSLVRDLISGVLDRKKRMRAARAQPAGEAVACDPPLTGRFHHGQGFIVSGSLRIARDDFEAGIAEGVRDSIFEWICTTLNAEIERSRTAKTELIAAEIECIDCVEQKGGAQ